jgi:hypothetical protein
MAKKVSACRVEPVVIYHCEIGNKCDFFVRESAISVWHCDFMNRDNYTCTLRAAQRAGRRQSRKRA